MIEVAMQYAKFIFQCFEFFSIIPEDFFWKVLITKLQSNTEAHVKIFLM